MQAETTADIMGQVVCRLGRDSCVKGKGYRIKFPYLTRAHLVINVVKTVYKAAN